MDRLSLQYRRRIVLGEQPGIEPDLSPMRFQPAIIDFRQRHADSFDFKGETWLMGCINQHIYPAGENECQAIRDKTSAHTNFASGFGTGDVIFQRSVKGLVRSGTGTAVQPGKTDRG